MKGHPDVIDYLKDLLRGELAARDQYFVHSRRYEDLGLQALYERIDHEMQEEAQHARPERRRRGGRQPERLQPHARRRCRNGVRGRNRHGSRRSKHGRWRDHL